MEIASASVWCECWWLGQQWKWIVQGGKSKRPWTFKLFIITPTPGFGGIWFCLNIPIDMQVSKQVGGSQLSFRFAFRKQYVIDGGKDGEQSGCLIISPLFQNTVLIEEILRMHLSVKFRIFKTALFITPDLGTELLKMDFCYLLLEIGTICGTICRFES